MNDITKFGTANGGPDRFIIIKMKIKLFKKYYKRLTYDWTNAYTRFKLKWSICALIYAD